MEGGLARGHVYKWTQKQVMWRTFLESERDRADSLFYTSMDGLPLRPLTWSDDESCVICPFAQRFELSRRKDMKVRTDLSGHRDGWASQKKSHFVTTANYGEPMLQDCMSAVI